MPFFLFLSREASKNAKNSRKENEGERCRRDCRQTFFEPCIEFGGAEDELAIQGRVLGHEFQNSMEGIDI